MRELKALEAQLKGWPDQTLTLALLLVAGALILVALAGPTLLKAGVLAWAVFP